MKGEEDLGIIEEEPNLNGEFEEENEYYIRENIDGDFQEEKEMDPMKRYENAMKKIDNYYNYSTDYSENKSSFLNQAKSNDNAIQEEIIENKSFFGMTSAQKKKILEYDIEVENLE